MKALPTVPPTAYSGSTDADRCSGRPHSDGQQRCRSHAVDFCKWPRVRCFRRAPWENGAGALIGLGILMLVQPFSLDLYGYSFVTILVGTIGFVVVSHFPE